MTAEPIASRAYGVTYATLENGKLQFESELAFQLDDGSLLVSDTVSRAVRRIRFAQGAGVVSTLAGDALDAATGTADGDGPSARFGTTSGIAVDANGVVYVGDGNLRLRVLTPR